MIYWPYHLAPQTIDAYANPRNVSGNRTITGGSQTVGGRAALWQVKYQDIPVPPEKVRLWRLLSTKLKGTLNSIVVPLYEGVRAPGVKPSMNFTGDEIVSFDRDVLFDQDVGFQSARNYAATAGTIARGSVLATLQTDSVILEGMVFSVNNRAYVVEEVIGSSGGLTQIKFFPTAREAVSAGEMVDFDRPTVKVRLAADDEMRLPLTWGRYGKTTVEFVEDLS